MIELHQGQLTGNYMFQWNDHKWSPAAGQLSDPEPTGYIAATRIDTCARYSGNGWIADWPLTSPTA